MNIIVILKRANILLPRPNNMDKGAQQIIAVGILFLCLMFGFAYCDKEMRENQKAEVHSLK